MENMAVVFFVAQRPDLLRDGVSKGFFAAEFARPLRKDPFVCPRNPGFSRTNPVLGSRDFSTIHPTNFREETWILRD